jgi:hypothetical protein
MIQKGIQIRPRHASEFDRRIRSLNSLIIKDIKSMLGNLPSSKADLHKKLFEVFELHNAERSLVMNYEDYLQIYGTHLSAFFFSSTESAAEFERRKDILVELFGAKAKVLLRKKIAARKTTNVAATAGGLFEELIPSAVAEHTVEVVTTRPASEVESRIELEEEDLWESLTNQRDAKELLEQVKRYYPEVVEDPSAVIAEAGRIGLDRFVAKMRRSYIFK